MKKGLKRHLAGLLTLALSLIVIEGIFHALTAVSPAIRGILLPTESMMIDDASLGHRPNPDFFDHDARGFRNAAPPDAVRVVALGDSFTYGVMVARDDAWPQQFEAMTGISTYNMGVGGYGPAHSYILLDEAIELEPSLIVFGMYGGNDLLDCFGLVYNSDVLTELRSTSDEVLKSIEDSEAKSLQKSSELNSLFTRKSLQAAMKKHSRLYGLIRAIRNSVRGSMWQIEEPAWKNVKATAPQRGEALFESPGAKTMLTIERRLYAINLDDVRIQEGHRICSEVIRRMNEIAKESGVQFVVALFPTKELAFKELLVESGLDGGLDAIHRVTGFEDEMWQAAKQFFEENGILYFDTLPFFREMLRQGDQPYRVDSDMHFNPAGNKAVAELLHDFIIDNGLLSTAN